MKMKTEFKYVCISINQEVHMFHHVSDLCTDFLEL